MRFIVWAGALALAAYSAAADAPAARIPLPTNAAQDFTRRVRPILSENCFTCHGPDEKKRKAGLRLDLKSEAFKKLKSDGFAIVPGDSAHSELVRRVTATDPDEQMPPPKSGKHLTPEQVQVLRQWVEQGAPYREHWSYVRPEAPSVPDVHLKQWPRNPIDYFVLHRLEEEGLRPTPEASRETLVRRASLDLTGLPPTPEEVEAFLRDNRSDAYERWVDRLLSSPRYGERWARPWLDQARYADSNGYEADFRRTIWPYRDWVIGALNHDIPFDQFTIEQLAGDLLPNCTREQKIATGFHRNTMVNTEGGTDDEEFRVAALVDRVNTTFGVWMGTTIGCAQCHSHKYDPFTQREYYQIFAIFNQTADRGRSNDPELELPTPDQQSRRDALRARIAPLEKQLATQTPALDSAEALWQGDMTAAGQSVQSNWIPLPPEQWETTGQVTLTKLPDHSLRAAGPLPDTGVYQVVASPNVQRITALRIEALADGELPHGSCGRSEEGDFVLTEFIVNVLPAGATAPALQSPAGAGEKADASATEAEKSRVALDFAYADFSMDGYSVRDAIDGKLTTGWSIAAYEPANRVDHEAIFAPKEPLVIPEGARLAFTLKQQSNRRQHLLGRFRLSLSTAPIEAHRTWGALPARVRALLSISPDDQTPGQAAELSAYYRGIEPQLDPIRTEIETLRKQEPKDIATTLVMQAVQEARPTHILVRGSHLNPGDPVEPGTPAILHSWPAGQPTNRLGFARWLVDPANPLVGRVTMNRIWAQYFGRGLVETSEDFGSQGELPSHPDLLDWLATEFVSQGWSQKAMHRLIATSATYRQASDAPPQLAERDPFNRLLARGPRVRMEAEMLRDNALAIGGLLKEKIGGPSVFPHQPDGVWNSPYNGDRWVLSKDGNQFRRGVYTFWRRTAPYASFGVFDAPSREVMCERRPRSNTPVQALVTLNDPAFVAAASGLAQRLIAQSGASIAERLSFAFESCTARHPAPDELPPLVRLYEQSLAKFSKDPAAAKRLAQVGLPDAAEECNWPERAAWTVIANVLLNLDEVLTKG